MCRRLIAMHLAKAAVEKRSSKIFQKKVQHKKEGNKASQSALKEGQHIGFDWSVNSGQDVLAEKSLNRRKKKCELGLKEQQKEP